MQSSERATSTQGSVPTGNCVREFLLDLTSMDAGFAPADLSVEAVLDRIERKQ
ncbi:MAG: hypothetical protein AAGC57_19265 [Pseudomonadota bacterium]